MKKRRKKKKFSFSDYREVLEDIEEDGNVKKKKKKKKIINTKEKNNYGKKRKSKKEHRALWKKILSVLIILFSIGVFSVGGFLLYIVVTTSEFDPESLKIQEQSIVYDAKGKEIASLGYELREKVTYDQLPQVLVDAIVATEDSRFFQHNGVDLPRFLKAATQHAMGNSKAGGASTLTMQVVKNNLTSTKQTIIRKFKDMYLATFFMERKYSKEEILEFYVNDSNLGSNVYGVGEASEYYFGKSVSELSLPEAALIAGLYQAPNTYNPYYNPENANNRIKTVLKLMVRHGYITQEEADATASIDIASLLVGLKNSDNVYQGYLDTVLEEVEEETGYSPYMVSMKIYTALDTSIQEGINDTYSGKNGYKFGDSKVQAGVSVINCNTGEIVAVGTGRKENNDARTWNYATRTKRQPGSTAKPLFAYGPGMEYLGYSTGTLFMDEPWSYTGGMSVSNWDNSYQGLITLRQAVAVSRNIPALKAFQEVNKSAGNKKIVEFVENLGIDLKNDYANESFAIGGLDEGVTTVQMAAAYAAFANGGYYNKPHAVTKIEYRETGETVEFKGEKKKVMSESTAYLMNNTLEYAVNNGFSGGAKIAGSHVAAKTGTSNFDNATRDKYNLPSYAENDLWTVAYTKDYSVAVWYGYDSIKDGYNTTGTFKDNLMNHVFKYIPKESKGWSVPSSVVATKVEKESWPMQLPSEYTPSNMITTEYFAKKYVPVDTSPRYAKLSDVTNLSVTSSGGKVNVSWDAKTPEVLSNDYLNKYFSQAMFGNSGDSYKKKRISYNNNNLGGYGYGIYTKNSNGSLTLVKWTNNKSYSFSPSITTRELTIVVKAEYKDFKSNASNGVSSTVTVEGINLDNIINSDTNGNLSISLLIGNTLSLNKGYATESMFKYVVRYDGEDVTNSATVTAQITGDNTSETCSSCTASSLKDLVNSLDKGSYTISYTATYSGEDITTEQKVFVR